jgi:hypothetical protein
MSASANVLIIARSRSGLAAARLSSARACRGRLSGAVIVLISFELRHLEDQPVAVHLCGHHPDAGANPRIRSNPYTTSQDATRICRAALPEQDAVWQQQLAAYIDLSA